MYMSLQSPSSVGGIKRDVKTSVISQPTQRAQMLKMPAIPVRQMTGITEEEFEKLKGVKAILTGKGYASINVKNREKTL